MDSHRTGLVSGTKVQVLSDNLKAGDVIEADVNVDSTDTNDNPMFRMVLAVECNSDPITNS
jgi:hypothetical protein